MIKTIILLVIVFYTFPCWKINAQSRDTSNIFAGYYIAVYNKSDLSHKKIRRHHKHSYNTAIDSRYRTYFIPIKIGKNNINQENVWKEVTDNKKESDTIFIFPDSTDIKLFKQIGLIDSNISDKKHLLLQEIKSLPYYNTASNKAYLFKCLYVKGTFLQLRIDTIDKNWQDYLLDIYSISTKKKKKLLLVTGIDSLHSIKSDRTSIQARPYIKTGQQKPCTALIVGNWFAGEEGYIRKEALLEQGEPFVSWIRCNDCPQIRFNESDSGSVVYPGPPVSWNDPSNPDDPQAGYGYIPNDTTKEETFFYHSDHLGSTSYITDDHANITQYDAYLPYGELLVDEHSSSENMPYKFNGKEMDEETGLYYYGARYLNPVTSLWYGVDPLAEKYVTTGGYVYTLDNPVKLVDTDGRKVYIFTETKGTGHTFVAIADSKGITVYTYGRYGDGLGPVGEGVLVRYNGDKAKNYIKSELYRMEAKAFQIKDASDSKVRNYFDSKYNVSSTRPDTNKPNIKKYGKVIDEYNLFNNNCTTMSSDAIKAGGSTVFDAKGIFSNYDEDFVIPSSLQKYLEKSSKDNKNVNDATDRLKTYYSQAKKIERINGVGSSGSSSGAMGSSSGSSANTSSSDTSSSGSGSGAFGSSFNSSY